MTKKQAAKILALPRPIKSDDHDEWRKARNKRKAARKVLNVW